MKIKHVFILLVFIFTHFYAIKEASAQAKDLKLVFIRHGEKPIKGDNLTCQGLNRALQLPALLYRKFGVPAYLFVPGLALGESTKHARMFQTISPLAIKYNLPINSSHAEKDSVSLAEDLKSKTGTIVIVWEHKAIAPIVRTLGIFAPGLLWPDNDYDSIWIVAFINGKAVLTKDKEGLKPLAECGSF